MILLNKYFYKFPVSGYNLPVIFLPSVQILGSDIFYFAWKLLSFQCWFYRENTTGRKQPSWPNPDIDSLTTVLGKGNDSTWGLDLSYYFSQNLLGMS